MDTNLNKIINKILYIVVMQEESSALLDRDKFIKDEEFCAQYKNILESFIFTNNENNTQIILIRPLEDPLHKTGLFGTEIAFFQTYVGIKHYSPDVVISMGYAGEVACEKVKESVLTHGSVVIAKQKSIYHRRNMIIEFFQKTSEGHYPLHSCETLVKQMGYHSCNVGTSNSFVKHDHIAAANQIKVVEMELCSVARACYYFNVACIGIKIISDTPDNLSDEERMKQFLDSLPILKDKFYETYKNVNNFLLGKSLSEI
jgi:nucleoside phosphorylase